jgi:signal peptidase II
MVRRGVALSVVAAAVLVIDQASKLWATGSFPRNREVTIVSGWLWIRVTSNSGATLDLLPGHNGLFVAVSVLAIIAAALLAWRGDVRGSLGAVALGMIAGGALGNLADRLRLGAVTDFIEVHGWPTDFNLADAAIRIGVLLLVAALLLQWRRPLARPSRPG